MRFPIFLSYIFLFQPDYESRPQRVHMNLN